MNTRLVKVLLLFISIHILIGWVARSPSIKTEQPPLEVKSVLDKTPALSRSVITTVDPQ
jgi:hypothetical protein